MSARRFKILGLAGALLIVFFALIHELPVYGQPQTRILVDMMGNKVEVADPVTRVALLGGPTGQIAYILGARDQLCAVTMTLKASELVLQMDPSIKNLPAPRSTAGQINLEELILSDPQLVIAGDLDGSIIQRKTRIPVALLKSTMNQSFDLLKEEIRFYGNAFGRQDRAEKYIEYLDRNIERIRSRTRNIPQQERKKVFNGYSSSHLVTLGVSNWPAAAMRRRTY
jgi:iron complex transport system substrate-binding protein